MSTELGKEEALQELLQRQFRMDRFRPGQQQVIQALLDGRNSLAVFPTGGGKSLCYQLPAQLLEGLTLVVSPLIALMKDQCDSLQAKGIKAERLDSTLDAAQASRIMESARKGETKLLYVAPERFFNERFRAWLSDLRISMVAIDEAHCISQWGHNFRPDYLKLSEIVRYHEIPRVLTLTATATPEVVQDICDAFSIQSGDVVQTPFFRPNLRLLSTVVGDRERFDALLQRIRDRPRGPTLIYVTTQKGTESLAARLTQEGIGARAYHAGMETEVRAEVQQWFLDSSDGIVAATIAFGMGIDKSNIRYVYHYNPSKSLEAYAQEIGRAGRDGKDAICETLLVPEDRVLIDNFTYGDTPDYEAIGRLIELIAGQPDEFYVNYYRLSADTDIRLLVVRTLMTYLELDGYIQGTHTRYDSYQIQPRLSSQQILAHFDGERRTFIKGILASATKGRIWYTIPLPLVVKRLNEPRERIVKALDYLEQKGWIEVKVADLVHGYRFCKRIEDQRSLVGEFHDRVVKRERAEIDRTDQVLALLAAKHCLAWQLSKHFGQRLEQACGRCTACTDGPCPAATELPLRTVGRGALATLRDLVRQHPGTLGTPRQRARFLCGLSTPKITQARLSRDPSFGVCSDVPFEVVLRAVEGI